MSSDVIINYEDLVNFIAALEAFNATLASETSAMGGRFQGLGDTWRDAAYQRFAAEFEALTANLRRFQETTEGDTLPYLKNLAERVRAVYGL